MKFLTTNGYSLLKIWILSTLVCFSVNADNSYRQAEGIVQKINIAKQTITISAEMFQLLPTTSVHEESGELSFVGKLQVGDKVYIKYIHTDKQRAIKEIVVLPAKRKMKLK